MRWRAMSLVAVEHGCSSEDSEIFRSQLDLFKARSGFEARNMNVTSSSNVFSKWMIKLPGYVLSKDCKEQSGASLEQTAYQNEIRSPMHAAAVRGRAEIMQLLLSTRVPSLIRFSVSMSSNSSNSSSLSAGGFEAESPWFFVFQKNMGYIMKN